MTKTDIYVQYNTSYFEDKGYRSDVYVKRGEKWYQINVFDFQTLSDEITDCLKVKLGYNIMPNLVVVERITNDEIIKNVLAIGKFDYFEQILPCIVHNDEIIPVLTINHVTKEIYNNIPIKDLIKIY